jgi:hypothetical protein
VQPEAWQVELFRPRRLIEAGQHAGDFVRMLRVHLAGIIIFVRASEATMMKAPDRGPT